MTKFTMPTGHKASQDKLFQTNPGFAIVNNLWPAQAEAHLYLWKFNIAVE